MKVNPFREFLNLAADLTDRSEVDEDNKAVLDEYGHPVRYKSPELLELFDKFYKWNKEYGEPIILAEDQYDYLTARNKSLEDLAKEFGLEIEP